ncbi:MAG: HlyD family type I secretion periplasmic adaptor subunit [Gammaproteobacteria bacterium]|nr:HlyD family type I secretion periplasmic adaptor subunit [Gammaproteobacteria bacterium]MBU1653733.1 HlyD family type I secretion periplasmic adaptor subunit [Gammaproteobacteria bacterium]MBU1959610.1 HlyD family type I secretion periplasmic adaptor subunit [Gammaproteobacteria bacterium]
MEGNLSDGERLPETDELYYRRLGLGVIFLTFGLFMGWAALAPLQSAVVAEGRVVVASQNKTVQHLDGGLVRRIAVLDGDVVRKGQLLLQLDDEQLKSQLENVDGQLLESEANLARLSAEYAGKEELTLSNDLIIKAGKGLTQEILQTQRHLFASRRQALASEREVLRQKLEQSNTQIDGVRKQIASLEERKGSLEKDLVGLRELAGKNLVSQTQLRERERQMNELDGELAARDAEIAQLREVIAETNHRIISMDKEYLKEVSTQLRDVQAQRIEHQSKERALRDKLSRIDILAPVAGKIKGFEVVTEGAVIQPGKTIMEIVPLEQDFMITAQISPMDIDALTPGQQAEVRFSGFDKGKFFPSLYADLQDLSADVFTNEANGAPYYKGSLRVRAESLLDLERQGATLISGMPVEVIIKTGERTLLDYLIRPFRSMVAKAFNEA